MTITPIYLVTQFTPAGTAQPILTFFSESKAYTYVADLTAKGSSYTYTINPIELIGD